MVRFWRLFAALLLILTAAQGLFAQRGPLRVSVTPASYTVPKGATAQMGAKFFFLGARASSDGARPASAKWSSSNPAVASIDSVTGLVSAHQLGTVQITAVNGPFWGSTLLTVGPPILVSIAVTPASPSIAKGLTQSFTATGTYTDSSTQSITTSVNWTSSNTSIATIGLNTGVASGVAAGGPVTITAKDLSTNISNTAQLTVTAATLVSITVTPASPSIAKGLTQPFTATGTYTDSGTLDITTSVNWTSSNASIATIGLNTGVATGVAAGGPVTFTATDPNTNNSSTAQLTVTAATLASIAATPASSS